MGSGQDHLRFDRALRENGIIELGDNEYDEVHDRMDRDMSARQPLKQKIVKTPR